MFVEKAKLVAQPCGCTIGLGTPYFYPWFLDYCGITADSAEKVSVRLFAALGLIGESEPSAGNPANFTVGGCSGKSHFLSACGPCGAAWHLSQVAFAARSVFLVRHISSNYGGR